MAKKRVPAVAGWFTMDEAEPRLLGTRCVACGALFFPREGAFCRNPACAGTELVEAPLSRRGRLWSATDNHYAPPPPYVAREPFEPYAIAAVELEAEKMVVLGQVVPGVGARDLEVGQAMELVLGTLYEDAENEYVVWKWRPAARAEREEVERRAR
jgi:uncharacterized OB-fold protein